MKDISRANMSIMIQYDWTSWWRCWATTTTTKANHNNYLHYYCHHYHACYDNKYVWMLYAYLFSSSELKAQVSFSDHLSCVVCLSVRLSVCKLFTFSSSSPESPDQFYPNLAQSIPGWKGFKFVQMKGHAVTKGVIIGK